MTQELYSMRKQLLMDYYQKYRHLPSYEGLTELFDVKSKNTVHKYVQKFIDDGLIGQSDNGRLIPTQKLFQLRVLGSVQAGFPTQTEVETDEKTISLDEFLVENPTKSYMLTVSGDSMIDAGINHGDMVIVDRSKTPKQGDIVVARIGTEWTMKYLMNKNGNIFLRAANKKYRDIYPEEELAVGGVVTSVIRKYT